MEIRSLRRDDWIGILLIIGLFLFAFQSLKFHLLLDSNLLIALVLMPFIITVDRSRMGSVRYGLVALVFAGLWLTVSLQSLFFFAFVFAVYFMVEVFIGRLNHAALFFAFLCSPLSTYGFKVFGFPIRLKLTEWASSAFSMMGMSSESDGNALLIDGSEFMVEPACTGLKMVISGLLITLMIARLSERKSCARFSLFGVMFLLTAGLLLITGANFFRLIALVLFKFPEGSVGHELTGIASLAIYCILPLHVISPHLLGWFRSRPASVARPWVNNALRFPTLVMICVLIPYSALQGGTETPHSALESAPVISGYSHEEADFDGFKYTKENALLYVKPCLDFWRSDHNPIICWRGSGYTFSHEKSAVVNGQRIYTAQLKKEEDRLYTAWWFQNGSDVTTDQVRWRMQMAKGEDRYDLINVTCSDPEQLTEEVAALLSGNESSTYATGGHSTTPLVSKNGSLK